VSRLRVAVIGAGRLGGFHAQKLARLEHAKLVAVVDPDPAPRHRAAAECRTQPLADYRELAGRIDAAVVAAPTRLHHPIALDLLNQGVHLLVEKPLCPTAAQADELVRAARRKGVVLQVGHVERFNPALAAAGPYVSQPAPKYLEAVRASNFTFRSTDVGVVLDLMIHDIDLVLSLVRSPVRRVDALGLSVLGGHEDVANARLEFQCGCVATLSASRVSYQSVRQMHVWTPRAFASIDFAARKTTLVRPSETVLERRFDVDALGPEQLQHKEQILEELLPREEIQAEAVDALSLELADFLESIRTPRLPRVTGEDGRDAVAVAEQILDRVAAHAWDDRLDGPVGPRAIPRPSVLPAPHFTLVPSPQPHLRREAG
jgi:predicted dehydrogenase